ncbi:ribonuclease H-like domain-containing protein, partial [Ochromonadaceae sp. CCMP2298]
MAKVGTSQLRRGIVDSVERILAESLLLGYQANNVSLIKLTIALPSLVSDVAKLLGRKKALEFQGGWLSGRTFESELPYLWQFKSAYSIESLSWFTLPADLYSVRTPTTNAVSHCTVEVDLAAPHKFVEHVEWVGGHGRLCIMSIDIECRAQGGKFPDPLRDPVVQIAACVQREGQPLLARVFTLQTCDQIPHASVFPYLHEHLLLSAWRRFVLEADPDVITGYNIVGFDFPYLLNRAATLAYHPDLADFACLGRVKSSPIAHSPWASRVGTPTIHVRGRLVLDLLPYMRQFQRLSSNKLQDVSCSFLGLSKAP